MIEVLQAEGLLMCSDLENAVRGGVTDGLPGLQMLDPEFADDIGPGCMATTQDAGDTGLCCQFGQERLGKQSG